MIVPDWIQDKIQQGTAQLEVVPLWGSTLWQLEFPGIQYGVLLGIKYFPYAINADNSAQRPPVDLSSADQLQQVGYFNGANYRSLLIRPRFKGVTSDATTGQVTYYADPEFTEMLYFANNFLVIGMGKTKVPGAILAGGTVAGSGVYPEVQPFAVVGPSTVQKKILTAADLAFYPQGNEFTKNHLAGIGPEAPNTQVIFNFQPPFDAAAAPNDWAMFPGAELTLVRIYEQFPSNIRL